MPTSNSFRKLNDFYLHRSTSKMYINLAGNWNNRLYLCPNKYYLPSESKVVDSLKLLLNLCLLKVLGIYKQIVRISNTYVFQISSIYSKVNTYYALQNYVITICSNEHFLQFTHYALVNLKSAKGRWFFCLFVGILWKSWKNY